METINTADRQAYRRMTTDEQRAHFLKEGLFETGKLNVIYSDVDRAVVAAAVPTTIELARYAREHGFTLTAPPGDSGALLP